MNIFFIQLTTRFCNEDFRVFLNRTGIQLSDLWDEAVVCNHTIYNFLIS